MVGVCQESIIMVIVVVVIGIICSSGAGVGGGGIRVGARCGLTAQSLHGKNSIHLQVLAAAYLPVWVAGIRRPL